MQALNSDKAKSSLQVFLHVIGVTLFLLCPFIFSPKFDFSDMFLLDPPTIRYLLGNLFLILFFYANYYYFQPQLLFKQKFLLWLIIIVGSFFVTLFFFNLGPESFGSDIQPGLKQGKQYLPRNEELSGRVQPGFHDMPLLEANKPSPMNPDDRPPHENNKPHKFINIHLEETILKFLFVLSLSFLLKVYELWKESRREKRKAELSFLKSQINPHFLFNTLNGIYSLSITKNEKTPTAIIKLSELMRYVINETEKDFVSLKSEIDYLENYIELQQLRFDDTVNVHFDYSQAAADLMISPLLLIFFVENAFKYGISSSQVADIDIQMRTENRDLFFTIKNQKLNHKPDYATQKGLKNVARRLQLVYPARHSLHIDNTDGYYFTELIIKDLK